jgi:hypothetical protein
VGGRRRDTADLGNHFVWLPAAVPRLHAGVNCSVGTALDFGETGSLDARSFTFGDKRKAPMRRTTRGLSRRCLEVLG